MGRRCCYPSLPLPVAAVLAGRVGAGAVRLLPILARRHPLVDPVQAARLLKVTDFPRGGEALDGCGREGA